MSTKIPEYLSVGRPIFVVGPREICSVEYLESTGAAFVAASNKEVSSILEKIVSSKDFEKMSKEAIECAVKDFKSENTARRVESVLKTSVKNWQNN